MTKLTDTQLVILSTAAERPDGAVQPLAKSLNKGAATAAYKSLLKRGLIVERPAGKDDTAWREVEGQPMALVISEVGLEAIGVEIRADEAKEKAGQAPLGTHRMVPQRANSAAERVPKAKSGTKQAQLIALLKRKRGATIAEAGAEIGWQDHSVRGAISGDLKKKRGLAVTSEVVEGRGRVYRIAE